MADRRRFKTDYPAGPNLPSGALLNAYGGMLNSVPGGYGGGGLNYSGLANQSSAPPDLLIGIARITDASNSGGMVDGEVDAPRADNNKYTIEFRYWDKEDTQWKTHDLGFNRLDAGAYHSGSPGQGSIPQYANGDIVPVMFDPVKNWCVPFHAPPEQICSAMFRSQQDITPLGVNAGPYIDAVVVDLELFRAGNWQCMLPELTLRCGTYFDGTAACMPIVMAVRHYDMLRMTAGTHRMTTAQIHVYEHGMRIVPLGRLHTGAAGGLGEMKGANRSYTKLPGLQRITTSQLRWKDAPTFSAYGDGVRVEMNDPFEQWLVAIDIWAEARCSQATGAFLRIAHTQTSGGGSPADGDLFDAIETETGSGEYVHPAGVMEYRATGVWTIGRNAYLRFVDYQGDSFNVIGEQGRTYGPCQLVGMLQSPEDTEPESGRRPDWPVYLCHVGEQEYLAKGNSQAGTLAKGSSDLFKLYARSTELASQVTVTAKALARAVSRSKWSIVKRLNRVWYVTQWECD